MVHLLSCIPIPVKRGIFSEVKRAHGPLGVLLRPFGLGYFAEYPFTPNGLAFPPRGLSPSHSLLDPCGKYSREHITFPGRTLARRGAALEVTSDPG